MRLQQLLQLLPLTATTTILIAGDLGVEGAECDCEGLEGRDGVLKVHRELVLAHAPKL